MKALISGAGIAGLATGIALRQAGLDVHVFERSPEMREIGAGLMIWPNGTRSLQALGVEVRALTVQGISLCSWRGRLLIEAPVDAISERYGSGVAFIHRADLQAALSRAFGQHGLRMGSDVTGFAEELTRCKSSCETEPSLRAIFSWVRMACAQLCAASCLETGIRSILDRPSGVASWPAWE